MITNKSTTNNILIYASVALFSASFVWACWPVLYELIQLWTHNEDYSHGFLVVPIMIYLIWQRRALLINEKPSLSWLGLIIVILGLLFLFIGQMSNFRTLANISFICILWGSVLYMFGYQNVRIYGWELFMLVFMIPLPSRIYASLTLPLQLVVTKTAFFTLQLAGIPVFREGNILYLSNTTLEVVNACSGLRSIITILLLSYIMACLYQKRLISKLLLICIAVPLAVLANIIRVSILALFAQNGNLYFIDGIGHTMLGLFLFLFIFFMLMMINKAIPWVFSKK